MGNHCSQLNMDERNEVCFPFFDSRAHSNVETVLGLHLGKGSVLLSDGYGAYEAYAQKPASPMLNAGPIAARF